MALAVVEQRRHTSAVLECLAFQDRHICANDAVHSLILKRIVLVLHEARLLQGLQIMSGHIKYPKVQSLGPCMSHHGCVAHFHKAENTDAHNEPMSCPQGPHEL